MGKYIVNRRQNLCINNTNSLIPPRRTIKYSLYYVYMTKGNLIIPITMYKQKTILKGILCLYLYMNVYVCEKGFNPSGYSNNNNNKIFKTFSQI